MNTVILSGKLTKNAELRANASGKEFATFSIAVKRNYKSANGEYETDFFDCISSVSIQYIKNYAAKGCDVVVKGKGYFKTYTDKNGINHKNFMVNVDEMEIKASGQQQQVQEEQPSAYNENDPDLPF